MTDYFTRIMATLAALFAYFSDQQAREAHKHTHELACAVGAADLCKFHEAQDD
jgi:hypothetical protein